MVKSNSSFPPYLSVGVKCWTSSNFIIRVSPFISILKSNLNLCMWTKCKKTSVDETECNFLLFQKTGCDYNCVWCPEDDCYDDYGQDGEINETTSEYRAYTTCEIISIMPACINNVYYNGDLGKYYIANLVYDTIVRELGDWVIQQLECKNVSEEFAKKHEQ